MNNISIIADTGIQFLEFKVDFLKDSKVLKLKQEISFSEENGEAIFAIPEYNDESDCYVDRFDKNKKIEEHQVTTIKASQALSCYEANWLPFPIFTENHNASDKKYDNGPFGWCRVLISQLPSDKDFSHSIILAFDTKYDKNSEINHESHMSLSGTDDQNCLFSLADDIEELDEFLAETWIDKIIQKTSISGAKLAGIKESSFDENPYYHIGLYLAFLKMLKASNAIPPINVYVSEQTKAKNIEVDLILDIGNSRSCGVVLETSQVGANNSFSFAQASTLKLRNIQKPAITYDDAFEMRCEFIRAEFGDMVIPEWKNCFEWPSVVRVGVEAADRSISTGKTGVTSGMSSPKRYLWDQDKRENKWYYNPGSSDVKPKDLDSGNSILSSVSIDANGNIADAPHDASHTESKFSRKSLMTFALIEIILQAATYINSYEFRNKRGHENSKRVLKRVVLTSPTAMLNTDKKTFRECANQAIEILQKYYGNSSMFGELSVLPSADDVITNPDDYEDIARITKRDWGYDEATCAQLSFMYGEITGRYQNNARLFFEVEGKRREIDHKQFEGIASLSDFNFTQEQNAVTVASLDIGGGTTDLMICTYRNDSSPITTVLTPFPEFYEGFNLAGDDILKRIIERIVIPTIRKSADEAGCCNSANTMNFLFGDDTGEHSAEDKEYRKLFASQVAIPIAMYALKHAKEETNTTSKKYREIMHELANVLFASEDVLVYVDQYVQRIGGDSFNFKEIEFIFDMDEINNIITQVVQPMLFKLSGIIAQFDCDYLLLAGRPSTLPIVKDIINRYMPVTPDRVIPLGNYRIGRWYPFAKSSGMIDDPKTTVAVGAAIGLMAGSLGRLEGFRLNTLFLKNNIKSTARYIGGLDTINKTVNDIWFIGDPDEETIEFNGPMFIGMKQMNTKNWLSTPMYKIIFKDNETAQALTNRLPLRVELERDDRNQEVIWGGKGRLHKPRAITDKNDISVSNESLVIKPQTLVNEDGYWIDTGSFHLSLF